MLEVDIENPDDLHDELPDELRNDYPLVPKKLETSHNIFSNYYSNIANKYGIKIGGVKRIARLNFQLF